MKIFNIGLNKTATMSLNNILQNTGLRTLHDPKTFTLKVYKSMRKGKHILKYFKNIDFFSDLFFASNVTGCDKYLVSSSFREDVIKKIIYDIPDAKIIITKRDLEPWLASRVAHVRRNHKRPHYSKKKKYIWMDINMEQWIDEYKKHYEFIENLFDKSEVLYIDICAGDNASKLFDFLKIRGVPTENFPNINRYR